MPHAHATTQHLADAFRAVEAIAQRNTEHYATAAAAAASAASADGHHTNGVTTVKKKVAVPASAAAHVGRYGPADPEPVTHFHSTSAQSVTLAEIYRHFAPRFSSAFDELTGLMAVALMLRYEQGTGLPLTTAMIDRLFVASVLLVSKTHHDRRVRNGTMAATFSIPLRELNRLERRLLEAIDYRVVVFAADLDVVLADLDIDRPKRLLAVDSGTFDCLQSLCSGQQHARVRQILTAPTATTGSDDDRDESPSPTFSPAFGDGSVSIESTDLPAAS